MKGAIMLKKYLPVALLPLLVIGLSSCQQKMNNAMEDKYKEINLKVSEIFDNGNVDELDSYIAENAVDHGLDTSMTKKTGLAGIKEMAAGYHKIFPDGKTTIHAMAVSGDTLFCYYTSTGTTSEPFMGVPANTKMSMSGVDVVRFEGDKAVEHWSFMDVNDITKMMQAQQAMMKSDMTMKGKKRK
jgi:predicted ester cyclase